MVNGTVTLSYIHTDEQVEGKVLSIRALPGGTFATLDSGKEYPLDGPMMWKIVDFTKGEPEVGNTITLRRKMTTVIGPITRIDRHKDGLAFHVPDYPAPLFVGTRHDSWTLVQVVR